MSNGKMVFPTMITPYCKDGSVDYDTARKYVRWYADNGCDGVFAVCQSSEIFYLSLDERIKLNSVVYEEAKAIEREYGKTFTVVSSGHVSDELEGQAEELKAIAESGTDGLIFITNRLDINNEGDDVWINNAEKLLSYLPSDMPLGLYECPYPYKRLVTPKIFDWCISTGRFRYIKDTCCDIDIIADRIKQLAGSGLMLLNANCQTLLESLRLGGDGYCGIMANFHPKLYDYLCHEYEKNPYKADIIQSVIGTFGFTESGLPYPLTAKYNMSLCGIPTENIARNRQNDEMTEYAKDCVRQMKVATDALEKWSD